MVMSAVVADRELEESIVKYFVRLMARPTSTPSPPNSTDALDKPSTR